LAVLRTRGVAAVAVLAVPVLGVVADAGFAGAGVVAGWLG
jgi:hypothetical protein